MYDESDGDPADALLETVKGLDLPFAFVDADLDFEVDAFPVLGGSSSPASSPVPLDSRR